MNIITLFLGGTKDKPEQTINLHHFGEGVVFIAAYNTVDQSGGTKAEYFESGSKARGDMILTAAALIKDGWTVV